MIDLRSDTVTQPTAAMKKAMFAAPVGDDVFSEDPSINALQEEVAALFGMEAALFCPSGTMCNQIALRVHMKPLEEVICSDLSHIYLYEVGAYGQQAGISLKALHREKGLLKASDIAANIQPDFDWLPVTSLVWLENTCNGAYYQLADLQAIKQEANKYNLPVHIDGARLFNALLGANITPKEIGTCCDSLNFCFSKGLGAPVGSVIVGTKTFIRQARRVRKAMGGGMRQAGFLAAAASYALNHQVKRLADDHKHAKVLAQVLATLPMVEEVEPVATNIVIFKVNEKYTAPKLVAYLKQHDIHAIAFSNTNVRMVTHLDFTASMLEKVCTVLQKLKEEVAVSSW